MAENNFLLKGGVRKPGAKPVDLLVKDGCIAACEPSGGLEAPVDFALHEAGGQLLFPSFIDAHVHLREPGFEYKEDITSGLTAALHGGFGAVMPMANTRPVNDSAAVTRLMLEKAKAAYPHGPRLYPVGALSLELAGKALSPMGELREAGAVAISNDGRPVRDSDIFRHAVEYAATWGLTVIDHCEDESLAPDWKMNESETSATLGIKGQPPAGEALQVARDILLAEYLHLPIHLAHISCRESLELIRWGKARGVPITAETCPQYLFLDDSMLINYDTAFKTSPPLRGKADVKALRAALADGVIDMLVTDHAPHAAHEKEVPFEEAASGMIGLETAVAVSYDLVRQGVIPHTRFEELWCSGPARIFKLPINTFQPGDRADFFLFDTEARWVVSPELLHSKSHNTPWLGRELSGRVSAHWLSGLKLL
ncbi:MAG: dihydroorotase [Deltaproteobacteria bacterium]|nr:dihydroorotase [Deltaproteobacteria bacterium]